MKKLIFSLLFVSSVVLGAFPGSFPSKIDTVEGDYTVEGLFTVGDGSTSELRMNAGATNQALINMANNDGSLNLTGGTSSGNGARVILYGGNAAGPNTYKFLFADNTLNVIEYDWDATAANRLLALGDGSIGVRLDANTMGVFGVTPVARTAAYTPTNVSADRSYDANSTTVDELADVLGTVIADLQSYGWFQ